MATTFIQQPSIGTGAIEPDFRLSIAGRYARSALNQFGRADGNGRKTVQAKDVLVGESKSEPMLVVKSKVKDAVSGHNVAGDFADALNALLIWHVSQAAARGEANGRRTVMAKDL